MHLFKLPLMKKNLHITASLDQPELLENMVEKLACRRSDSESDERNGDWQLMNTSSVEKYVSGTVALSGNREETRLSFVTCFIFCCTKEKSDPYRLHWSMSLS